MTEREVVHECIEWLRGQGWICRRQHVGLFMTQQGTPIRLGEVGESDWRCIRPKGGNYAEVFELEMKAPGKKPKPEQLEYMAKRRHQGLQATWASSLTMLKDWCRETYGE